MRKYAIIDILRQLPYEDYRLMKSDLPKMLGVSSATFNRWLYLKKSDKGEIPLSKLKRLADLLHCDINQLIK